MKVLASNLKEALRTAINSQRDFERKTMRYPSDSALIQGWIVTLDLLEKKQNVEVDYND